MALVYVAYVLQADIQMGQPLDLHVKEALYHLLEYMAHLFLRKTIATGMDPFEEIPTFQVRHHHVDILVIDHTIKEGDNVSTL